MTQETLDPLFLNHLAFLAAHRGEVRLGAAGAEVSSDIPGFSSFTPWDEASPVPAGCPAVRLVPGCGTAWPERLAASGFALAEALSYMALEEAPRGRAPPPSVRIVRARSEAEARVFADIQYRGFIDPCDADAAFWQERFARVATDNVARASQDFLVASMDGAPAAVALVVRAAGLAGLYAVATAPEFRNAGLSTRLLAEAYASARAAGQTMILQAMRGSYAESFYAKLGFLPRYISQVWRRAAAA